MIKKEDLITFITKCKHYKVVMKPGFAEKYPGVDPSQHDVHDLMCKYYIQEYLENPYGPAMEILLDNQEIDEKAGDGEYVIDGKYYEDSQEAQRLIHNNLFTNKLVNEIVNAD